MYSEMGIVSFMVTWTAQPLNIQLEMIGDMDARCERVQAAT
jgi:hypothetical protein